MNTVDELVDYCRELEPVGALMLSGEWGCGKTYLIEHDLKDTLNTEAIVLRISLFGISAAEEIHSAVRNQWVDEYCKAKKIDKYSELIKKGKIFLENYISFQNQYKEFLQQIFLYFSLLVTE